MNDDVIKRADDPPLSHPNQSTKNQNDRSTLNADITNERLMHGTQKKSDKDVQRPFDWSESLVIGSLKEQMAAELVKLGVIDDSVKLMNARSGDDYQEYGRVSLNENIMNHSSFKNYALEQIVDFESAMPGNGLLENVVKGDNRWRALPHPVIAEFANQVSSLSIPSHGKIVAIIVPWLKTGGAQLVALWHYKAALDLGYSPVMILTDDSEITELYFNENLFCVNIPMMVSGITGASYGEIDMSQKIMCLFSAINLLRCTNVHVIHSWVGYNMLSSRDLRGIWPSSCAVSVSAFCPHIHKNGKVDGYFLYIPQIDRLVSKYIFDNTWYEKELQKVYGLPDDKTMTIYYPVAVPKSNATGSVSKKILWASRLDYQKNPTIVFDIAKILANFEFHIYGKEVMEDEKIDWSRAPSNVCYKGSFEAIDDIPLSEFGVFLYTAIFDGMPNILLEIGARGLPIISSNVGGVTDFLNRNTGLLVEDPTDVQEYVDKIEFMFSDQKMMQIMQSSARKKIEEERSYAAFLESVRTLFQEPITR